ncbi:MAG: 50S ribosomal protein L22 [Candidatus Omnitrophota bacterium]|nr:50S ribosomal protein L22 [Candidatus Omnitrophota bacterium]
MIVKAKGSFLKVTPTKARQIMDLIRGKEVDAALAILNSINKRPVPYIIKILNSAVSNAKQKGIERNHLYISKIVADNGPTWKRTRAAAFGRATRILKRTAHITIELDMKLKS